MNAKKVIYFLLIIPQIFLGNAFAQQTEAKTLFKILKGQISKTDFQSYVEVPFSLPSGVKRISVEFSYNRKEDKTTIDLGILDPNRFRGWSGGARSTFTISEEDATPGYLPGIIPPGIWKLLLGIPNIRDGVVASYEAKIFITNKTTVTSFSDEPIKTQEGWYRGDLHAHSGHSDGKCLSQSGKKVPSPAYKVVEAAAKKGLDFIALTEHNSTSQYNALRELQPVFDQILLIPGREITTFFGHANIYGITDFIDFRMSNSSSGEVQKWMDKVNQAGGIVSVNHPGVPSGEQCMGCGWLVDDMPNKDISAVELINGGSMKASSNDAIQGWDLWHKMLNTGQHVTAIGGSDDHRAGENVDQPGIIGNPTTVIYMKNLSTISLINGIKSGRVFIDIEGSIDRFVDLKIKNNNTGQIMPMGQTLYCNPHEKLSILVTVKGVEDGEVEFIVDGKTNSNLIYPIKSDDDRIELDWKNTHNNHYIYTKIKDKYNKLVLVSNPVYLEAQ
jgi:hypothetical protein